MDPKYFIIWIFVLSRTFATFVNIPGDVVFVGLFKIWKSEAGTCSSNIDVNSVMLAESVKWYINHLNKYGGLPFNIGFKAFATCGLTSKAARATVDIVGKNETKNEMIIGIIGPELSSESRVVSSIISSLPSNEMLAQVSFSATDVLLGDATKFKNFVRVVPNNNVEIMAMIQTMIELKWNRISVVYEDNDYGRDGAQRLQTRAKESGICISEMYPINTEGGVDTSQVSLVLNDIIFGTELRPSGNGIVLFATSSVIHTILLSMSALNVSPVPIVMVSDGFGMNIKEFQRPDGASEKAIKEAKGTMAVVPPYLDVTEFSEHWKRIFTNISSFQEESATNPYLIDVFKSITDCDVFNCDIDPLSIEYTESEFRTQPLYVQYAIMAAHALAKTIQDSLKMHCPLNDGICSDFKQKFEPAKIIENMKGIHLDFSKDFSWRSESLSNISGGFEIAASGELYQTDDKPAYEIYNYREVFTDGSDVFDLMKVGEYFHSRTKINHENIRDYTGAGVTKTWPNLRRAYCPLGKLCSECMPLEELQETVYFEPGDRYVVGVVPVYNTDDERGCGGIRTYPGYQAAESMKFAVEDVNNKTASFAQFFPGMKIGLVILNSCNNPVVIQRKIYNLHYNGVKLPTGDTFVLDVNKVIGYVGEVNSDITIGMAEVLTMMPFVQVSYASTSDKLSDRKRYPRFMRVVTPVTPQAKAIIELVKHTNSNYIQIVHSDTVYGNNGKDSIVQAAIEKKICVIQKIPFQEDENEYEIYDRLRRYPHARIVIVFLQSYKILRFVSAILSQMDRGEFMFIGSQTWHHTKDLLDIDTKQHLLGSYSLAFEINQDPRLLQRIRSIQPQKFSKNPWSTPFLQARGNCYYDDSFDKTQPLPCSRDNKQYPLDYLDTYVYIATISLLTGANSLMHKTCSPDQFKACPPLSQNVPGLIKEIREVKLDLDGSGLDVYVFNDNNDGNIGFRVYNIQRDSTNLSKMVYIPVGRYSLDGRFDFDEENIIYPTSEPVRSTCPNSLACTHCDLIDDQTPITKEETGMETTAILGILLAVFGLTIIVLIVVVIILYRKYKGKETGKTDYNDLPDVADTYITARWDTADRSAPDPCPPQPIPTTEN